MTLRNTEHGPPKLCEHPGCDRSRGASLRSEYIYGCVLCVSHESGYQRGDIQLPESATQARKQSAESDILG